MSSCGFLIASGLTNAVLSVTLSFRPRSVLHESCWSGEHREMQESSHRATWACRGLRFTCKRFLEAWRFRARLRSSWLSPMVRMCGSVRGRILRDVVMDLQKTVECLEVGILVRKLVESGLHWEK